MGSSLAGQFGCTCSTVYSFVSFQLPTNASSILDMLHQGEFWPGVNFFGNLQESDPDEMDTVSSTFESSSSSEGSESTADSSAKAAEELSLIHI